MQGPITFDFEGSSVNCKLPQLPCLLHAIVFQRFSRTVGDCVRRSYFRRAQQSSMELQVWHLPRPACCCVALYLAGICFHREGPSPGAAPVGSTQDCRDAAKFMIVPATVHLCLPSHRQATRMLHFTCGPLCPVRWSAHRVLCTLAQS